MGKGSSSKAPSPDPQIGQAALKEAQLGQDWLNEARKQFEVSNTRQIELDSVAKAVSQQQMATQERANQWAAEDRDRYKSVFQPLQDSYIDKAKNWDSKENQAGAANEARADVLASQSAATAGRQRQAAAMGINPTSGRYEGIERTAGMGTALQAAGAQNIARTGVRKQAVALQADALNLGNGLPSQATGALGLGVGAGSAAVGTVGGANQQANANVGILQGGYQTAMQGYGAQANILQGQYNGQLNAWSQSQSAAAQGTAGLMGGLGSMAGMIYASSKDYKEEKEPVDGALKALKRMPVEKWKYKDGIADGGEHIGPYAEDFQKATGQGDGKSINGMDAIGVTMKAVQELAEKVDSLRPQRKSIMRKAA